MTNATSTLRGTSSRKARGATVPAAAMLVAAPLAGTTSPAVAADGQKRRASTRRCATRVKKSTRRWTSTLTSTPRRA